MSPRPYNLGKRQAQIDQGRRQVLDAARALLAETTSYAGFTVDAVAKRADVARATVYYQFGSKTALLEAVCDDLAASGGMAELPQAFTDPDPQEAWRKFVTAFARFWAADRPAMRRLRALASLDPDVATVIEARDQRRRQGIEMLAARHPQSPCGAEGTRMVARLYALTSFETFDALAAPTQPLGQVATDVIDMTEAVLRAAATRMLG